MRNMEISTRRMSKRSQEPVDQWLVKEGYFRKHTPRDPTCLFRAISEQVYFTQYYHIRVRKECIAFMKKMRHLFEKSVTTSFDNYLEQMACFTEWGSVNEIQAMSLLYKKDIIVFNGQKQTCEVVTDNGFKDTISLCHTAPKQYETIYKMDFVQIAAYCQSIVYEILYKEIFNMSNIATIVHKMLHDRNSTFRHDRFFLKGNLDIREQLTIDLYNKVEGGNNNISEAQSELRGIPPIPYKVAKALDPGIYRNTDFDIWHEMRQEVKYAGWSRHSNNELQIGGKCLIQINYNDDLDRSNNNHYCFNSMKYDTNGTNTKIVQQKSKQENSCFCGYIQEMGTNEEPVLVFIEELGEKRIVPFAALKPLPLKKNKQNNWIPTNKRNALTDSTRRWRKTYNASRKKKDNLNITNELANNRNTTDNNSINSINKINYEADGRNTESSKLDQHQISENYVVEKCPNYATNELINNMPMAVMLDNSQSATTNNIIQEINEEHKKPNTTFMKHNTENSSTNKTSRFAMSNNSNNNGIQNMYSKQKLLEENYSPRINNSQMNMNNPNLIYITPDSNSYPLFSYFPGNPGEYSSDNQMDHLFASRFFYNLGLEYLRVNQTWNYGPIAYGPNHYGTQPLGIQSNPPANANNVPYIQEEVVHLVNEVQNCSLTHNEGGYSSDGREIVESITKMPLTNINGMQNVKQQKQGTPKNQASEKPKQNNSIANKVNKVRHQNSYEPVYAQTHQNQYDITIPNNPAYELKKNDAHIQHFDPMIQQTIITPSSPNGCISPYTAPTMLPTLSFYPSEAETCCNPYYIANGAFLPFQCAPAHPDVTENNMQPYASHIYPGTDTYPPNYPATLCSPIMFSPPVPCSILPPPPNMQEHWYPMLGQPHYMQYGPPPISITEASGNGQSPNGSP